MTKSSSKAEDSRRDEQQQSQVYKKHGGVVVESISVDDLDSFNDAECKHPDKRQIEDDDSGFLTYECINPDCHEIFLYDKN